MAADFFVLVAIGLIGGIACWAIETAIDRLSRWES